MHESVLNLFYSWLHKQYRNDNIVNFVYLPENSNVLIVTNIVSVFYNKTQWHDIIILQQ